MCVRSQHSPNDDDNTISTHQALLSAQGAVHDKGNESLQPVVGLKKANKTVW